MTPPGTDLAALAARRGRRAGLLSALLASEPDEDLLQAAAAMPSLVGFAGAGVAAVRADYAEVVLRLVPLHESVFTGPEGQAGPVDPALLAAYRRWGVDPGAYRVPAADHLGVQLALFATLCEVEARAWSADQPEEATRAVEAQRALLADHAGGWATVAAEALARAGKGTLYGALAAVVDAWVADEADRLRPAPDHGVGADAGPPAAPDGPLAGPARIARRLLAPARAGGYLLASDVAELAAAVGAPWRAADGRGRLRHVVESVLADGRPELLRAVFGPRVAGWQERWLAAATAQPGMARHHRGWGARATATARWLDVLAARDAGSIRRHDPPVLVVGDQSALARAVLQLSAGGLVVTVDPAPDDARAAADAVVRLDPGGRPGWTGNSAGLPELALADLSGGSLTSPAV